MQQARKENVLFLSTFSYLTNLHLLNQEIGISSKDSLKISWRKLVSHQMETELQLHLSQSQVDIESIAVSRKIKKHFWKKLDIWIKKVNTLT